MLGMETRFVWGRCALAQVQWMEEVRGGLRAAAAGVEPAATARPVETHYFPLRCRRCHSSSGKWRSSKTHRGSEGCHAVM